MNTVPELVKKAMAVRSEMNIEAIRLAWKARCGDDVSEVCESCRAYSDAIRAIGGTP